MKIFCLFLLLIPFSISWAEEEICASKSGEQRSPNFLLIMVDDISPEMFGAYGNQELQTPHIDRLAKSGVQFATAWATPMCSSSRTLLATGRYPDKTGMWHNDFRIEQGYPPLEYTHQHLTFARELQKNGYATALAGNVMAIGGELDSPQLGFDERYYASRSFDLPNGQIFDGPSEGAYAIPGAKPTPSRYWYPCMLYNEVLVESRAEDFGPDMCVDFLIDFMDRNKKQPFFAYYPMLLVHTTASGKLPTTPLQGIPGKNKDGSLEKVTEYVDVLVGRLLTALDDLGLRDNTIVIFTSDNGTQGKGKIWAIEEGPRVPFIVNSPEIVKSRGVTQEITELSDVFPTLIDFAGVSLPDGYALDGKSLKPFLTGKSDVHRNFIFSYIATARMVRSKNWLLEAVDPVYGNDEGRLFYCGSESTRNGYKEMTLSQDPEAIAARQELEFYLDQLPKLDYESEEVRAEIEKYNVFPYRHYLPGQRPILKVLENYGSDPK